MRKFDDFDTTFVRYEVEMFNHLPDKAKELYFAIMRELAKNKDREICDLSRFWVEDFDSCKSPIEKIFMMAFNIVSILRRDELQEGDMGVAIFPQHQIVTDKNKYYADFLISIERCKEEVSVVVECDGHNFHEKTKEQIKYDNEREYQIKKQGYDILHFSGSQIYNEPMKCANDVFDYLLLIEERVERHGNL